MSEEIQVVLDGEYLRGNGLYCVREHCLLHIILVQQPVLEKVIDDEVLKTCQCCIHKTGQYTYMYSGINEGGRCKSLVVQEIFNRKVYSVVLGDMIKDSKKGRC